MFKHIFALACLSLALSASATTIETLSAWNVQTLGSSFGETSCTGCELATFGQTFTLSSDANLTSFKFLLKENAADPDNVDFAAYVMAWGGNKATGNILYQSGQLSTTNNGGAGGFEAFQVNTGPLILSAGTYVAFFSASNYFDGEVGSASWGLNSSDVYSGGQLVFLRNGDNTNAYTNWTWTQRAASDLAFSITYSAVPVPATAWLFGSALIGLAGAKRKK